MANFFSILAQARPFLETTYLDTFSVLRNQQVPHEDNPHVTVNKLLPVDELKDLPCKMNFVEQLLRQDSPENALYDINPIGASILVFTVPTYDIRKGDTVVINRKDDAGNTIATYDGIVALPDVNLAFQRFMVRQEGEA